MWGEQALCSSRFRSQGSVETDEGRTNTGDVHHRGKLWFDVREYGKSEGFRVELERLSGHLSDQKTDRNNVMDKEQEKES